MNRIIISLLAAFIAVAASAADIPALRRVADASQAAVTSPSAPCNSGDEPFAQFLVKFTTDGSFAKERTSLSPIFALKSIADYRALVVASGHETGYIQTWQVVDPSRVKLVCGYDRSPDYSYIFARGADGKWKLVDRVTEDF